MSLAMAPEKVAELNGAVGSFMVRMQVSMREAGEVLGRFANQLARAFGVPMHVVAPEWETRVERARRQRVATMMRTYHRRATRRAARARRRAALRCPA